MHKFVKILIIYYNIEISIQYTYNRARAVEFFYLLIYFNLHINTFLQVLRENLNKNYLILTENII